MNREEARALIAAMSVDDCREINAFRDSSGAQWRKKMRELWDSGKDTGAFRRLRNTLGPSGLNHWGRA